MPEEPAPEARAPEEPAPEEPAPEEPGDDLGDLFGGGVAEPAPAPPAPEEAAPAPEEPAPAGPGDDLDDLFGAPAEEAVEEVEEAAEEAVEETKEATEEATDDLDDLFGPSVSQAAPLPMRPWVDDTGHYRVNARLIEIGRDFVRLLKENGATSTVPMNRLSVADRDYVGVQLAKHGHGLIGSVAVR